MQFLQPEAYQPLAARLFQEIADQLRHELPRAHVEHIGSSSIHGAISKGDLDVYVGVEPGAFEDATRCIEKLGFSIKEGSLRTEALCPFESTAYALDVGVQLVANRSRFEFFLTFRDVMNANETLRAEYNALKATSVGLEPDEYRRRKSRFIEQVLNSRHG